MPCLHTSIPSSVAALHDQPSGQSESLPQLGVQTGSFPATPATHLPRAHWSWPLHGSPGPTLPLHPPTTAKSKAHASERKKVSRATLRR